MTACKHTIILIATAVHDNTCTVQMHNSSSAYCPEEGMSGIQWSRTEGKSEVSQACSLAGSLFRRGTFATRRCSVEGVWSDVDLSTCTLIRNPPPFLLLSFVLETEEQSSSVDNIISNEKLEAEVGNIIRAGNNDFV